MTYTDHAVIRSQQRGVPPLVVDLLMQFGARERSVKGSEILYFDRGAKKRVESYTGGLLGKLNEHLDAYVVVSEGRIVTVGPRYKRIKEFYVHN